MNNPNPFVPKGSLLEQQSKRQSRMKLAVFCVLAISVTGLMAMLIQGCKREQPDASADNTSNVDTNLPTITDTNIASTEVSNPPVILPPVATNVPPPAPVLIPQPVAPEVAAGADYVVVKGDTLGKIAKKNGVTLKALKDANPGVIPTKLKVGQKLTLPAGGSSAATASTGVSAGAATADVSGDTYTVKSGDTLTKIAKANGTTVKALEAANGLSTTKIKVGQKLKIPVKADAAASAPTVDSTPAPAMPPVPAPVETAPAPTK